MQEQSSTNTNISECTTPPSAGNGFTFVDMTKDVAFKIKYEGHKCLKVNKQFRNNTKFQNNFFIFKSGQGEDSISGYEDSSDFDLNSRMSTLNCDSNHSHTVTTNNHNNNTNNGNCYFHFQTDKTILKQDKESSRKKRGPSNKKSTNNNNTTNNKRKRKKDASIVVEEENTTNESNKKQTRKKKKASAKQNNNNNSYNSYDSMNHNETQIESTVTQSTSDDLQNSVDSTEALPNNNNSMDLTQLLLLFQAYQKNGLPTDPASSTELLPVMNESLENSQQSFSKGGSFMNLLGNLDNSQQETMYSSFSGNDSCYESSLSCASTTNSYHTVSNQPHEHHMINNLSSSYGHFSDQLNFLATEQHKHSYHPSNATIVNNDNSNNEIIIEENTNNTNNIIPQEESVTSNQNSSYINDNQEETVIDPQTFDDLSYWVGEFDLNHDEQTNDIPEDLNDTNTQQHLISDTNHSNLNNSKDEIFTEPFIGFLKTKPACDFKIIN
ncbi:hypothetical protein ABK040_005736 [Willaertia magna]